MKKILSIIFLVFVVFSCKNIKNEKESELTQLENKTVNRDTLVETNYVEIPSRQKKQELDSLRNPYHNAYLTDLSFRKIGELVLIDSVIPMDNNITFKLLDTISTCSENEIGFYLKVFDKIMLKSDGALAEVVGLYTLKFIRKRPEIFVNHIDTLTIENVKDWANYTSFEMYFEYDADSLVYNCQKLADNLKQISTNDNLLLFEKELVASANRLIKD